MSKGIAIVAAFFVVFAAWGTAAAEPGDIAGVVAALNARAVTPAPGDPGEDGAPSGEELEFAAWTVGTPSSGPQCFIDVAVLGASTAAQVQDVVNNITGDARVASVTGVVITAVTPTLAELQVFDAVLVFTNSTPLSSVTLGNNLADYVDGGGGVVLTMFSIRASVANRTIEGRFLADNYYCIERTVGASTTGSATLGTVHVPAHALMAGVGSFNGGTSGFRSPAALNPNATRVADWSTGQILVAARTDLSGGRVDLGFFAVSQLGSGGSWLVSTDGALLLRNAVVVSSGCSQTNAVETTSWGSIKGKW